MPNVTWTSGILLFWKVENVKWTNKCHIVTQKGHSEGFAFMSELSELSIIKITICDLKKKKKKK